MSQRKFAKIIIVALICFTSINAISAGTKTGAADWTADVDDEHHYRVADFRRQASQLEQAAYDATLNNAFPIRSSYLPVDIYFDAYKHYILLSENPDIQRNLHTLTVEVNESKNPTALQKMRLRHLEQMRKDLNSGKYDTDLFNKFPNPTSDQIKNHRNLLAEAYVRFTMPLFLEIRDALKSNDLNAAQKKALRASFNKVRTALFRNQYLVLLAFQKYFHGRLSYSSRQSESKFPMVQSEHSRISAQGKNQDLAEFLDVFLPKIMKHAAQRDGGELLYYSIMKSAGSAMSVLNPLMELVHVDAAEQTDPNERERKKKTVSEKETQDLSMIKTCQSLFR